MIRIKIITFITGISLSLSTLSQTCPQGVKPDGFDIIVVAGQSNAVGSGVVSGNGYRNINTNRDHRIFQLGRWGNHDQAILSGSRRRLEHVPHHGQSNVNLSKKGFGIPFARLYAINNLCRNRRVLIIPVAKGSTSMMTWDSEIDLFKPIRKNGTDYPLLDSHFLFNDMKSRINYALQQNSGNRLVAFLWQQGEADILTMAGSQSWQLQHLSTNQSYNVPEHRSLFRTKFANMKKELRAHFGFKFVFLAGLVSEDWVFWHKRKTNQILNNGCHQIDGNKSVNITNSRRMINNQIKIVADNGAKSGHVRTNHIQRNHTVTKSDGRSSDCGLGANIHFSAHGHKVLARRYYQKYQQLNN